MKKFSLSIKKLSQYCKTKETSGILRQLSCNFISVNKQFQYNNTLYYSKNIPKLLNTNVDSKTKSNFIKYSNNKFSTQVKVEADEIKLNDLEHVDKSITYKIPKICNIYTLSQILKVDMISLISEYNNVLETQVKEVFEYLNPDDLELFLLENEINFEIEDIKITKVERPLIITIMGHVDHGKTTLLDALRSSHVADGEFGAITQSIGAFNVNLDMESDESHKKVTVIDTPGHEAFAKMRLRGAKITDLIILVISGTEGIKNQTVEVLDIIKSNNIPFIIAINKFDLEDADIDDVKTQLLHQQDVLVIEDEHSDKYSSFKISAEGFVPEGNKIYHAPYVCISAKYGKNLNILKEKILEKAKEFKRMEISNLPAQAYVIESTNPVDTKFNAVRSSVINKIGILKEGDYFLCGTSYGKIRTMKNDLGETVDVAYPGQAVEITGFKNIPQTGSMLCVVENSKVAENLALDRIKLNEHYQNLKKENIGKGIKIGTIKGYKNRRRLFNSNNKVLWEKKISEVMNSNTEKTGLSEREIRETYLMDDIKTNRVVIKADTEGVLEAIQDELLDIFPENILDRYIQEMVVGPVGEEDIEYAKFSKNVIFCFNLDHSDVLGLCSLMGVGCRSHKLIFQLVNEVKAFIEEASIKNDPSDCEYLGEVIWGIARVVEIFEIKHKGKSAIIAGIEVLSGTIHESSKYRVCNSSRVKGYNLKVASLKQNKQNIALVREEEVCGLILEDFNNIELGDKIYSYNTDKTYAGITECRTYVKSFNHRS